VDDSEAILAYERAALSGHYAVSTATNGQEALKKTAEIHPAAVLLDLSMPVMNGDEVLARIKADPDLKDIPVIVISSERDRAEACMKTGAAAYLPKPIRAEELRVLVARVLEEHSQQERKGSLAVLFVGVGTIEAGLPLDSVEVVIDQPATVPLAVGPSYLSSMFDLHGSPVCVLDMARRLGTEHQAPLPERKMVVISSGQVHLALNVDRVRDPEEYPPEEVVARSQLGGTDHGPLKDALVAVVRTARGALPVIDPKALLSRKLLRELPGVLRDLPHPSAARETPSGS
jgi:CheY-like chemotaxis protein